MTKGIVIATLSVLIGVPVLIEAQETSMSWVGTWSTGPLALDAPPPSQPPAAGLTAVVNVKNQTLRQIVHTSIAGDMVRVSLSNRYGDAPLKIGGAHIAQRHDGAMIRPGSHLTFNGHPSVTIEAGSTVLSDAVTLDVPALGDLAIDLFFPGDIWEASSPATIHSSALTTNYVSVSGNHLGVADLPVDTTIQQWLFISRVDVLTDSSPGAIVTLGDSITDGTGSTPDTNNRWPDYLARRLATHYGDEAPSVLNVGIAGNRVLSHNAGLGILQRAGIPAPESNAPLNPNALFGPSALSRFNDDVLLQTGVTHIIVLETTNDIGMAFDAGTPTVEDLIAAHRTLIQRARAHGLKIYAGTLTPFEGAFYWTPEGEAKRAALNDWLRTSGAYDAVFDFDAAVRDPEHPTRFKANFHPGDWLHPNDAGYAAMADAIDLTLFSSARDKIAFSISDGPRTPWGAPDLGGVWDFRTITPLERPEALGDKAVLTPEEAATFQKEALEARNADRRDGGARRDVERAYNDFWWDYGDNLTEDLRTSLITNPTDGRIPTRLPGVDDADALRRDERRHPVKERVVIGSPAHGPEDLGLSERCILGFNAGPPMLPSAYNNNFQLYQTPNYVVIYNEMVHDARIVPLDDRPHLPGTISQWLGDSRGHWEGNTLVVESTNFTGKTGSFYTIARSYGSGSTVRLVERFTRIDDDRLLYAFTVDDPTTFSELFTAEIPMNRTDAPMFEYACHEGNYGMTNLLAGARVQEHKASASAESSKNLDR